MNIIEEIINTESIDSMEELLSTLEKNQARELLHQKLYELVEYNNITEWNNAVKLCEALSIIGWGEKEHLNAISHFNGDCWNTFFITHRDKKRFRAGRWKKRKYGWLLFNPEYHFSPDKPDQESLSYEKYTSSNFEVVAGEKLLKQKNYQKGMPIVMGMIGGNDSSSDSIFELNKTLTNLLYETLYPYDYGEHLEKFYLTLNSHSKVTKSYLEIGRYNLKQKSFYCQLYFDRGYAVLNEKDQKAFFSASLLESVDALEKIFKRRKIHLNFKLFRSNIIEAIQKWQS